MSEETEKKILEVLSKIETHLAKNASPQTPATMWDREEVAAFFKKSPQWVARMVKEEGLPELPGHRYDPKQIEVWARKRSAV